MEKRRKRVVRSFGSNWRLEIMGRSKLRRKQKKTVYRINLGFLCQALGPLNYHVNFGKRQNRSGNRGGKELRKQIDGDRAMEAEKWNQRNRDGSRNYSLFIGPDLLG